MEKLQYHSRPVPVTSDKWTAKGPSQLKRARRLVLFGWGLTLGAPAAALLFLYSLIGGDALDLLHAFVLCVMGMLAIAPFAAVLFILSIIEIRKVSSSGREGVALQVLAIMGLPCTVLPVGLALRWCL